jgi:hypothetical protein
LRNHRVLDHPGVLDEHDDLRTLQAFACLGSSAAPVRVHGVHPILRKLWHTLDLATDDLQFV